MEGPSRGPRATAVPKIRPGCNGPGQLGTPESHSNHCLIAQVSTPEAKQLTARRALKHSPIILARTLRSWVCAGLL